MYKSAIYKAVKKILNCKPLTKISQGSPKYRWEDNFTQDICQMKIQIWIACVQDLGKWKEFFDKVKTFNQEVQRLDEEEEEEEEKEDNCNFVAQSNLVLAQNTIIA